MLHYLICSHKAQVLNGHRALLNCNFDQRIHFLQGHSADFRYTALQYLCWLKCSEPSHKKHSQGCSLTDMIFAKLFDAHLLEGLASQGTRKFPGSAELQGVSSMRDKEPMPASAMFLATCSTSGIKQRRVMWGAAVISRLLCFAHLSCQS